MQWSLKSNCHVGVWGLGWVGSSTLNTTAFAASTNNRNNSVKDGIWMVQTDSGVWGAGAVSQSVSSSSTSLVALRRKPLIRIVLKNFNWSKNAGSHYYRLEGSVPTNRESNLVSAIIGCPHDFFAFYDNFSAFQNLQDVLIVSEKLLLDM